MVFFQIFFGQRIILISEKKKKRKRVFSPCIFFRSRRCYWAAISGPIGPDYYVSPWSTNAGLGNERMRGVGELFNPLPSYLSTQHRVGPDPRNNLLRVADFVNPRKPTPRVKISADLRRFFGFRSIAPVKLSPLPCFFFGGLRSQMPAADS